MLTPEKIKVVWSPSIKANGQYVNYELHYQTENIIQVSLIRNIQSRLVPFSRKIHAEITNLKPSKSYKIWVVAKTKSSKTSESEIITATTVRKNELRRVDNTCHICRFPP